MAIKNKYLVEKRNVLNELRSNNMTLQELRFFSIYLSKINARDVSTRVVRFPLADFQKIMEFGRLNIAQLKATTDGLLMKVVSVPIEESGGYRSFQIFKECTVDKDSTGEWYVEIDAHDRALPLMFEFKSHYFTYELWNALRLRSGNQVRMYELLKQYEKLGERILAVDELKELLGIEKNEYPRFNNFKTRVLDACQEALAEYTDICFAYEPYGRRGTGGKIIQLKFTITKNANYANPLELEKFIELQTEPNPDVIVVESEHERRIKLLMGACNNEFSYEEVDYLNALIADRRLSDSDAYGYLEAKYKYLATQKRKIKTSRYGYLRTVIESEAKDKGGADTRRTRRGNGAGQGVVPSPEELARTMLPPEEQQASIMARRNAHLNR